MKKILALVLALMLSLCLAACGGKDNPGQPGSSNGGDTPPVTSQPPEGLSKTDDKELTDTSTTQAPELPEDVRRERGLQELVLPQCTDFTYSSHGSGFSMQMGSIDKAGFEAFAMQFFDIAAGWGVVYRNVDDQEIVSYEDALVTEDYDTASLYGVGNYSFHCRCREDGSTLLRYKLRYFEEAGADDYGSEYPAQTVKLSIDTDNAFLALLESGGSAADLSLVYDVSDDQIQAIGAVEVSVIPADLKKGVGTLTLMNLTDDGDVYTLMGKFEDVGTAEFDALRGYYRSIGGTETEAGDNNYKYEGDWGKVFQFYYQMGADNTLLVGIKVNK